MRPPLGSLIVSGQAGSADHPASGMANDSRRARVGRERRDAAHIEALSVAGCVCTCVATHAYACKHIMKH